MLVRLLPALLCALPLGLAAQTDAQLTAAQRITGLSDTFSIPQSSSVLIPMRKNVLLLDECVVTIVKLVEEVSFLEPSSGSTYSGVDIQFDLTLADLHRNDNGTAYGFVENNIFGATVGEILFGSTVDVAINIHKDLAQDTSIQDIIAAPVSDGFSGPFVSYAYQSDDVTPEHMATLAAALIDYKRDFCTMGS